MADPDVRRMCALLEQKPRLYHRYPFLYPLAVGVHRVQRRVLWLRSDALWATARQSQDLPVPIKGHDSVLLRQLGESEMYLQHNKVTNLRLAASRVDGLLIRPGEVFSFNKVVGNCTRRRGYLDGMRPVTGRDGRRSWGWTLSVGQHHPLAGAALSSDRHRALRALG